MYSAILAALAAHGQPTGMAAARICLEYGVGLPKGCGRPAATIS